MGFSLNDDHVQGFLFTPRGKWKYTVLLDYTGLDFDSWDLWSNAEKALKQATEKVSLESSLANSKIIGFSSSPNRGESSLAPSV